MQINRNNYGAFFLDYAEKNLDEMGRRELARFLGENPDLQDEFFEFENVGLKPDKRLIFEPKSKLKHLEISAYGSINQDNYEDWIVAFLEGDLSTEEVLVFESFRKINPLIEKEISVYKLTFLKQNKSIVFRDKYLIKKKLVIPFGKRIFWYAASIAAIFIIAFSVFRLLSFQNQNESSQQAKMIETTTKSIEKQTLNNLDSPTKIDENQEETQYNSTKDTLISSKKNRNVLTKKTSIAKTSTPDKEFEKVTNVIFNLDPLIPTGKSLQIIVNYGVKIEFFNREDFAGVFDDMILRDVIIAQNNDIQHKKNALGRVFANLGNKILNTGNAKNQEPAIINSIASRGKETFLAFAGGLPIYRTFKKDEHNKTVFAIGENLSIALSRRNEKGESSPPDNR